MLRTQGKISQAQEKVANKVSQTLDKLDNIGDSLIKSGQQLLLSPTHEAASTAAVYDAAAAAVEVQRPTTPKFLEHFGFDDYNQDLKSITSEPSSEDTMSVATLDNVKAAGSGKKSAEVMDMEHVDEQVHKQDRSI